MSHASTSEILRGVRVNDTHSKLNPSWAREVNRPESPEDIQRLVRRACETDAKLSVAGARHAMGGQQFGAGTILCDMTRLNRVLRLKAVRGLVEVEAGITWPELVKQLHGSQAGDRAPWTIIQKQTGADRLTIGGAVAANIHGRGLTMTPFVGDIESLALVNAHGDLVRCSRGENSDLFRLVIGGYGLFGIVYSVTLRLARRREMQRAVEITTMDHVMERFCGRVRDGYTFGDFQYMTDERSPDFLRKGVMACYREVPDDTPIPDDQSELTPDQWRNLIHLGHVDKARAYELYTAHYKFTSGQIYWSDTMQMSTYLDDYHESIDERSGAPLRGSEMITEIYVPRDTLAQFMQTCASDFRRHAVNVIYGTVRLIERDDESFLAWAREPWACVIFNLHVDHTPNGILHAADAFRRLIDRAIAFKGTYYLTYHRFATPDQLHTCYPRFPEFIGHKRTHDPGERFVSDWYLHYR